MCMPPHPHTRLSNYGEGQESMGREGRKCPPFLPRLVKCETSSNWNSFCILPSDASALPPELQGGFFAGVWLTLCACVLIRLGHTTSAILIREVTWDGELSPSTLRRCNARQDYSPTWRGNLPEMRGERMHPYEMQRKGGFEGGTCLKQQRLAFTWREEMEVVMWLSEQVHGCRQSDSISTFCGWHLPAPPGSKGFTPPSWSVDISFNTSSCAQ